MKKLTAIAVLAAIAFGIVACDGPLIDLSRVNGNQKADDTVDTVE